MTDLLSGVQTLHSRAEAWECDFNGHWNTRFYCKAFQTASEVAAMLGGSSDPKRTAAAKRQLRFHAEMHSGDPLTIRSFNVSDASQGPLIAHYMTRYDKVVATAVDFGLPPNPQLTELPAADAAQALPRGIVGSVPDAWVPDNDGGLQYELGPVLAEELGSDGHLMFGTAVARMSHASHHHDLGVGFTLELMKEQAIGRMLAEMRYTRLGPCRPGDFLRVAARMTSARGKAFSTAYMVYTHRGTPLVMFELCTLSVDMKKRRAMLLPEFVTARLS